MGAILLPRKRLLRAHGKKVVFAKGSNESAEHVLMKALIWALYLPMYPDLTVEIRIGDRYKPDVVQLDAAGKPTFWGESGKVSPDKIESLARRYRGTHFVISKWSMKLDPVADLVRAARVQYPSAAPFDLLSFPHDAAARFVRDDGTIQLTHADIEWVRIAPHSIDEF
ncbi:MAG: hypothetical protein SGI73_21035 [Chloroflexota bacterium]|nr:hypothetical protein [Chloroflexota bacterium]